MPSELSQCTDNEPAFDCDVAVALSFENLEYQQRHIFETNITKTLKQFKSAGILEGAVVPRHVPLDPTQMSVVHAFIESDGDPMLMIGAGGYGKSEVVYKCKELLQHKCAVAATTGKAAALIDGSTIHALLNLPTRKAHEKALSPALLACLQEKWLNISHLIIDEFSMMNGDNLFWIHHRLQEAKGNLIAWGGVKVMLSGDPAQLPPVVGHPLWGIPNAGQPGLGHSLYLSIQAVFVLQTNYRQSNAGAGNLQQFLQNYRTGHLSQDNFNWFSSRSREQIGETEWLRSTADSTHLFPTNALVDEFNDEALRKLSRY